MKDFFENLVSCPDDPILSQTWRYQNDPRAEKVNLGVGMYMDESGRTPVLDVVKEAEEVLAKEHIPHTYIPISGLQQYDRLVQKLVFGEQSEVFETGRACTVQTLGGTGALSLGMTFLNRSCGCTQGASSIPTWGNHNDIMAQAGLQVRGYRYYDRENAGVDFSGMIEDMKAMPAGTVVVLHACCHNPTGYDLSESQWHEVIDVCRHYNLVPFLDMAYQGFKQGLNEDAMAVRLFAESGLTFLAASSFSKSFNLYGERVGALTVVTPSAEEAERVQSHLKSCARADYSNPPAFGGRIVEYVLSDPERFARWEQEVAGMRERIRLMRRMLAEEVKKAGAPRDFSFVERQAGMFSFTGFTPEQIDRLATDFGIYAVRNGRICICGLNQGNVRYVAQSFARVMQD